MVDQVNQVHYPHLPSLLPTLLHFILSATPRATSYYYTHFADEETEKVNSLLKVTNLYVMGPCVKVSSSCSHNSILVVALVEEF